MDGGEKEEEGRQTRKMAKLKMCGEERWKEKMVEMRKRR